MKIVSWNILAQEWIDQKDYPMIPSSILFNRSARFKNIYRILSELEPDVILLQEVMNQEYQKVLKLFGAAFHISQINVIWGTSGNVSLFSKKLFKNVKNIEYPFGTVSSCDDFTFINVHLEEESVEKRCVQMKEVISKNPNIIGGDFNHQYKKVPLFTRFLDSK